MKKNDKIQKKLDELKENYYKQLPQKIEKIEKDWQKVSLNFDKENFHNLYRDVHSLAGLSGTFGYSQFSQSVRDLEVYLDQLQGFEDLNAIQLSEVSHLLDRAKDAISPKEKQILSVPKSYQLSIDSNKIVYINYHIGKFQKELKNHLEQLGFSLDLYKGINSFLNKNTNSLPSAIIVDEHFLSDEHIKELTILNQKYQLPFICIAKHHDIETRLKAIRVGISVFINKPFDVFYITNRLIQLCDMFTNQNYRILILDDSEPLANYYALILREAGMQVKVITRANQLMDALQDFNPNLLLMDLYIPGCTGLELTKIVRQEERYASLPIIFISTETDRFKQLSILNSCGGDDFLTKPVLPQNLVAAVKSRAQRSALLVSYIRHDSLTKLLNHSYILTQLEFEILRAQRQNKSISIAMVDIDNFKEINDEYGHPVGDVVLIKTADFLATCIRKSDYIGRYGGDEFAIIFPDAELANAKSICMEIRRKFSKYIFSEDGKEFKVTLSFGLASFPHYSTSTLLVAAGDRALYKAKSKGRNRVEIDYGKE